jgi:hypothetical protein
MGRPKNHSNIFIIKELAERVGFESTLEPTYRDLKSTDGP